MAYGWQLKGPLISKCFLKGFLNSQKLSTYICQISEYISPVHLLRNRVVHIQPLTFTTTSSLQSELKNSKMKEALWICGLSNHFWWIPAIFVFTVQSWKSVHVCVTQCEVKKPGIVLYSVWIWGLWQHWDTLLHSPAQQDLQGNNRPKGFQIMSRGEAATKMLIERYFICLYACALPVQACVHSSLTPPAPQGQWPALLSLRRSTLGNTLHTPHTLSSALSGKALGEILPEETT